MVIHIILFVGLTMDFGAAWQRYCDAIHMDDDAVMNGWPHTAVVRGCVYVRLEDEHTKKYSSPVKEIMEEFEFVCRHKKADQQVTVRSVLLHSINIMMFSNSFFLLSLQTTKLRSSIVMFCDLMSSLYAAFHAFR